MLQGEAAEEAADDEREVNDSSLFRCCHATRSETGVRFRILPSLSFCAASPKCDPLERQLPAKRQRPECVVFHKLNLKG